MSFILLRDKCISTQNSVGDRCISMKEQLCSYEREHGAERYSNWCGALWRASKEFHI